MQGVLTIEEGAGAGASVHLAPGETARLGCDPGASLRLVGPGIAARHTEVRLEPGRFVVVDRGGSAGTAHNDVRLAPRVPTSAAPGDDLRIGEFLLRLDLLGPDGEPIDFAASVGVGGGASPVPVAGLPPGAYELQGLLGEGAVGRVYRAVRRSDGRAVAVKLLRRQVAPGSPERERFVREGRLAARIRSPFVTAVLDCHVEGAVACLVVERVDGPSVAALVAGGPVPVPAALRIGEDVARALDAAAAAGVVHRDVKPSNVLLCPTGVAKLTDFGVAKDLRETIEALTLSGQGLGTLAYMPPEQLCEAKRVDPRSDLYGLGATLYHLVAGRPPFDPRSDQALFEIVEEPPPPLGPQRPDCPAEVVALVEALLAKEPADRPGPARVVAEALARLRERVDPDFDSAALFARRGTTQPPPGV